MVLYGVQSIIMQTLDPITRLPGEDSRLFHLACAETVELEPNVEEGEESIKRCNSTGAVLANRRAPDSFVGYDITLTDNEWNAGVMSLINGYDYLPTTATGSDDITTIVTPMLADIGQFVPFRMVIFAAAYEGSEVSRYVVFVLNNCNGRISPISLGQDWVQFEYTINAREATTAGLPIMSIGYYEGAEAPSNLDGITITSGVIQPQAAAGGGTRISAQNQNIALPSQTSKATVTVDKTATK